MYLPFFNTPNTLSSPCDAVISNVIDVKLKQHAQNFLSLSMAWACRRVCLEKIFVHHRKVTIDLDSIYKDLLVQVAIDVPFTFGTLHVLFDQHPRNTSTQANRQ